ncbi:hypothetical protein A5759_01940 [Mycobacterium sp. 852014-52144_SCH5372336]|nr:hypothetical protein A5759_01940 [Mycobacterium sp. 852014-52144_SCH5372336]
MIEDRVVTTAFLVELNQTPECDELQFGHGVLNDLEADAFHVLVPVGHTHGWTEARVVCQVQLAVGNGGPLLREVLISRELYESLPTAFSVLNTVGDLVPKTVDELDDELASLLSSGDDNAIGSEDDDEGADFDAYGDGDWDSGPTEYR